MATTLPSEEGFSPEGYQRQQPSETRLMSLLFGMLAIIGSAMLAGMMLTVEVVLGGYWKNLPPAAFLAWFARYGALLHSTAVTVFPAMGIGFAGMLGIERRNPRTCSAWLAASGCAAALFLLTIGWFAPTDSAFATGSIAPEEVSSKLDTWLLLHILRIALATGASALGLWAVTR